jgi:ppGpp synthetase/RelA/SpoT-type nucleotidyltranferase
VSLLPNSTLQFFENYRDSIAEFEAAALEAREAVADLLRGSVRGVQAIESRAKDPHSLLDKLRRKEYPNPGEQVKDLIGVRVITQYPDDAEAAAEILGPAFEIDTEESYDKFEELEAKVFDYRSIHLVARLRESDADVTKALGRHWFEIQVRSLLQHAWAEVDHEIKYKSGIAFPKPLERRFAAIAGSLETLDQAFIDMRGSRTTLIDQYRAAYENDLEEDQPFDAARLIACLEALRPTGASLRSTAPVLPGSSGHVEKVINDALTTVGLSTRRLLESALRESGAKKLLKSHAASVGATPDTLSHLVVCLILIWFENHDVLNDQFPELRFDSDLADTLGFEVVSLP